MAVPNIFATATTTIPLSQLDANFATAITLGNTAIYLGNTTTSIGNLTLTNATISSVSTAVTVAQGGTGLTSGTSGGVPYFSATTTMASSAALAANALMIGGGAGAAPATTTTGTGVLTALGVNTGTAGAFVVNGGALGTPSSGTVTNLTGTASININGTVGATTPNTGAFTTGSFSGAISVTAAATSTFRNDQNTDTQVYIRNDSAGAAATARFDLYTNTALASALTLASFGPGYTGSYAGVNLANLRYISDNAAAANSNGLMLTSGAKNVYIAPAATLVGTFSSTGLAITGTISATDTISSTKNGALFTKTGGTVNAQWFQIANTNNSYVGVESSAGGAIFTGSTAYAAVWGSGSNYPAEIYSNNAKVAAFSSTGLAVTGTLSATSTFASGGTTIDSDVDNFQSNSSSATKFTGRFKNTSATTPNGFSVLYSAADPNGTGSEFLYFVGGGTNLRASIRSNGGLANYSANNVNLSDMTIKTDFNAYDAGTLWSFGKRMKAAWGRFKYDDQTHDDWNNGYGAQLVREAAGDDFPELVESVDWDGKGNILTVYDNDLMHIMGAITTEAQYRIEEQEDRIARLEAALANAGISLQ